jgi:hypothetical protein
MGSTKSKQGYRLNREDLEYLKASAPTVVELMDQSHAAQKNILKDIVNVFDCNLIF